MNKFNLQFNKQGFTLIEVMVALTIIAIALSSLIKASGNHTYSASYLKNKTLAHYVAMNEVSQLQIDKKWPDLGIKHGSAEMASIEWFWTREVNRTTSDNIHHVKFTIFADEDNRKNLTQIQVYIANPAKAPSLTSNGQSSSNNVSGQNP